jgi:hypothetical protein
MCWKEWHKYFFYMGLELVIPGYSSDIQRRNLVIFDTRSLVEMIIHFAILNFCTSYVWEKNLLPKVIPVEIS